MGNTKKSKRQDRSSRSKSKRNKELVSLLKKVKSISRKYKRRVETNLHRLLPQEHPEVLPAPDPPSQDLEAVQFVDQEVSDVVEVVLEFFILALDHAHDHAQVHALDPVLSFLLKKNNLAKSGK